MMLRIEWKRGNREGRRWTEIGKRRIKTHLLAEHVLIAEFDGLRQVRKQHVLALLREAGVQLPVAVEGGVDADLVACAQLADARLQQILLDGPAHEVVVDGRLGHALVERDGFVIVFAF
jgi:hypothetical protein